MRSNFLSNTEVRELLQVLVRTPSINPTLAPDASHGEEALAVCARDWLLEREVEAWLEHVATGRPNVVAQVGEGDGPTLIFCAHIDTVSTEGMNIPPFEPLVEGDRVYGRGSYDMKGGVAAAMVAAAALKNQDLAGRVKLALVVDEEHSSIGADHFVANHPGDACIVTEPTEGRLILTHKGFVWVRLTTSGTAAHGSRWDLGVSAIGKMGNIIAGLKRFDQEELRQRPRPRPSPDVGPASLHAALVKGGVGISTYAPSCELQVERRTLPGETVEGVVEELERIVARSGEEARIEAFFDRQPLVCDPGSKLASCVRDSAIAELGEAPEETGVAYWTDAAIFAAAGIPALNYGPGGDGAHAAVEWVSLSSVVSTAKVLAEAARRFCH